MRPPRFPRRALIIYRYLFFVLVLDLAGDQADLLHAALHPASKPPQVRNQTGSPSHQNNNKDAEELSYIHQLLGE